MLNANDPDTIFSLRLLRETITTGNRTIVFWIGAGTSRWAGYPSWKDFVLDLRSDFFKSTGGFDNNLALKLIDCGSFPAFLQMCKDLDRARYYRHIAAVFSPRAETPLYSRFIDLLRRISPVYAVTTNVDEELERNLNTPTVVQKSDLTRIVTLLQEKQPFIGKLHGSCSTVESTVFSTGDYTALLEDQGFLRSMQHIFTACSVIFVGYGVRDKYVIDLLSRDAAEMKLFGPGPHFVITSENASMLPGLHRISYTIKLHPDHRAAMSLLDFIYESIQVAKARHASAVQVESPTEAGSNESPGAETAYFISDFKPPGTWHTSQTAQGESPQGDRKEFTVGLGFTNDEIPLRTSTALHDLVVGLICFDVVYLPLFAVGPAHQAVGSQLFWEMIDSDSLRLVHSLHEPAVVFEGKDTAVFGSISAITVRNKEGAGPRHALEIIRKQISAAPGKQVEAEALILKLDAKVRTARYSETELPSLVRGSLLMPYVSKLLGIGDAILPTQVPRWLMFPYLRMAHLVHTGMICTELGIQAAKVPFGGAQLVSAAFGIKMGEESAEQYASYVLSGSFNTDLGALIQQDLRIFNAILSFRNSSEGLAFRRAVSSVLTVPSGGEFAAAVNAGLERNVPIAVLQKAKDRLSFLLTNDPCVCGSGDKLRLCCIPPLRG